MKRLTGVFIILFLFFALVPGQAVLDDYEQFNDAEYFFSTEDYEEALYLFLQLQEKYPNNNNLNFRVGMSYLNIPGQEKKAIPYLEKAVKSTIVKYKAKNFDEKLAPHHAWFYLGNAYRINNQLDEALDSYTIFRQLRKFEKHYNVQIVENEVKACERAKIIKDNPVNLLSINLGELINTGAKTYQPVVNRGETSLAFMQEQKFYDAIMYSWKENGEWLSPRNITPQVGSDGDMLPLAFSDDGKTLLLVKKSGNSNGDIYISRKEGDNWLLAQKMGKTVNTSKNENHASLSEDGRQMIISSDRRGGMGGLDLWISESDQDGNWSEPVNLGSSINTPYDESAAYLMNGGKTLYFVSKGHFNMGGFDIFFSEKKEGGQWTDPVNIGFPLNTTNDNPFFQPVKDGKAGYIALFDEPGNFGEEDIYRVEILPFTEPLVPANPMFSQDFILLLENEETGEKIEIIYDRKNDSINLNSSRKSKYRWSLRKQ